MIHSFISIIIPAKNEEQYISQSLAAIYKIDYPKNRYEVIVVDNNSTDHTMEIAKQSNAQVLSCSKNTISALRNYGASKAKGEILAFIDADCVVIPDILNTVHQLFHENNYGAVGARPIAPKTGTWVEKTWSGTRAAGKTKENVKWLPSSNLFVKRNAFFSVGGFDERLETGEDYDLGIRLSKQNIVIQEPALISIHLREPKTIFDFWKKEIWRGKSNIKGLLLHDITLRELPSIVIPIGYLLSSLWFVFSYIFVSENIIWFSLTGYIHLICLFTVLYCPIALSFYKCIRNVNYKYIIPLSLLYFIYFTARAISICLEFKKMGVNYVKQV